MATLFIIIFGCSLFIAPTTSQIHENLIQCYRGNETEPWFGNTLQIFIELIRKLEDAMPTSLDIRLLSVNLLHRLRIDGIERAPSIQESEFITPYRANGIMAPKFRILLDLISDTPGKLQFEDYLTPREMCHLHRMLSASVEPFERGDESRTCPLNLMSTDRIETPWIHRWNKVQDPFNNSITIKNGRVSRCPLEMGAIRSHDYGSFSIGTLIASIAAGLQPQNVRINEFVELNYNSQNSGNTDLYANLESMTRRDTEKSMKQLLRSLDSIDNAYSAGLAGDLAEVCVFQGPLLGTNSTIGLISTWNSTFLPRIKFISESHGGRWEFTDAEILSGLDGIFISQQISSWVQQIRRLKLSQILDMYFSPRGIPLLAIESANRGRKTVLRHHRQHSRINKDNFKVNNLDMLKNNDNIAIKKDIEEIEDKHNDADKIQNENVFDNSELELPDSGVKYLERFSVNDGITNACHRKRILELIDKDKLKDETYFLSQILQFSTSSMPIRDDILRTNCDAAVDKFFEYSATLLETLPVCEELMSDYRKPFVDLTLIIDESRSEQENLEYISFIAELIDVSNSGSRLSVIHGTNANYLVNRTNSVSTTFQQLRNFTGPYPITLSLSRTLQRLILTLEQQLIHEQRNGIIAGLPQVVIITAQKQRVNQQDFDSVMRMMHSSLLRFPDLYFLILTNNREQFDDLIRGNQTPAEIRRRQEHYKVIETSNISPVVFEQEFLKYLKTIPKRIMPPFCQSQVQENSNQRQLFFEDYISPYVDMRYRISPAYLKNSNDLLITWHVNYGTVTICMARDISYAPVQCFTIDETSLAEFRLLNPCGESNFDECEGLYFSVQLDKSSMRCSENDCRYPDQVRIVLTHRGLSCEYDQRGNSAKIFQSQILVLIITFLFTLLIKKITIYN